MLSIFKNRKHNKPAPPDVIYNGNLDELKEETRKLSEVLKKPYEWENVAKNFKQVRVTYGDGTKKDFDAYMWALHGINILNNLKGIKVERK